MSSHEKTSAFLFHEPCPKCRSRGGDSKGDNLSRYDDGHGFCHSCGHYEASGGDSHDPADAELGMNKRQSSSKQPFEPVPATCHPLKARGISLETCQLFAYGIGTFAGEKVHVASYRDATGTLVAQHLRTRNKEFKWLGEAREALLFGQHLWKPGGKRVVVTEGEIDCLSVSQLQGNKWPVVSLPNGANAAAKAFKKSLEWLESFDEVVICFDMDEPGQEAAKACAALLSPGKGKLARLPLKDANDCLLHDRGQEVITAIWNAIPFRPDGIRAGADLWNDLQHAPASGYPVPYPELHTMLQGFRMGELYLFTAGSGIGKSTIVNEIAYALKMESGLPLGILALEENPARNARRYLSIYLNRPLHLPAVHAATSPEELRRAFDAVMSRDWWIYDHFGSSDLDTLMSKLRYMAVGLGVRVIVLDHISIVVSGLDEDGESERKTIDKLMTRLRALIEETGIMVLAVVHLRRPSDSKKSFNNGREVSLTDLRGSGSLEQLSDVVIALERDQQDEEAPNRSSIRVLKNRPIGTTGLAGMAEYNAETGRLLPLSPFGDESGEALPPVF